MIFLLLFFSIPVYADDVTLPPIVVDGSAADALLYDPVIPVQERKTDHPTSNGSLMRDLSESLPLPVTDYQTSGGLSQARGIGRSADDLNVEALGVPLNPSLGGGFNFSTFPQFFWSSYRFQIGPSTGGYDPRAASSTLSLIPWTATACGSERQTYRLTEFVTRGLNQASVGAAYGGTATLVGLSSINAKGPTGSISSQVVHRDGFDFRAHLLATSIDETNPGSLSAPSPNARVRTNRWIPVLEGSASAGGGLLKESLYYDWSSIRAWNPDNSILDSYDRSARFGSETAYLWQDWKLGLSVSKSMLTQIAQSTPDDWNSRVSLGKVERLGALTLEGSAEADSLSRVATKPGFSLGARDDLSDAMDLFFKTNFSYRFPSLEDRYYNLFGVLPNPGLRPERVWMLNPGMEWQGSGVSQTLQAVLQFRSDAQIFSGNQTQNAGNVTMESLIHDLDFRVDRHFDFIQTARLGYSEIASQGYRIPYDPLFTEVFRAEAHDRRENSLWRAGAAMRAVTRTPVSPGIENSGYAWIDLDAGIRVSELWIEGRIDNLMNRPIQVVNDYPAPGRLFALSVVGAL